MLEGLAIIVGAVLYRVRGGWPKELGLTQSTWLCRLAWAIPTGALIGGLSAHGPAGLAGFGMALLLMVTTLASVALYGHGAHMVYGPAYFEHVKIRTELLTTWWLERLFDGLPDRRWPQWRVDLLNMTGMAVIGLARHATAVLPLFWSQPLAATIFSVTGLLHGPLYRAGWYITPNIRAAEFLVGGATWLTIFLLWR